MRLNAPASAESTRRRVHLLQAARAADPDPLRDRVRLAEEKWDIAEAERIAQLPEAVHLPLPTLSGLTMMVYWGGRPGGRDRALGLVLAAQRERPGNFGLNCKLANYYMQTDPPRWAEAAHFWEVAHALRDRGIAVEFGLRHSGVRKQLELAAARGAARAVIVGPDERAQGLAVVRDLRTSTEVKVPIRQLLNGYFD